MVNSGDSGGLTPAQIKHGWSAGEDGGFEVRVGRLAIAEVYPRRGGYEIAVADPRGAWRIARIVQGTFTQALAKAEAGLVELGWTLEQEH